MTDQVATSSNVVTSNSSVEAKPPSKTPSSSDVRALSGDEEEKVCFNCGRSGHIRSECRRRSSSANSMSSRDSRGPSSPLQPRGDRPRDNSRDRRPGGMSGPRYPQHHESRSGAGYQQSDRGNYRSSESGAG